MTDYTPTTEEVRNIFSWNHDGAEVDAKIGFDLWLAEVRENAFDAGYQVGVVDASSAFPRVVLSANDYDQLRNALDKEEA